MNEFNECVHEVFSAAGDIIIKSMMGGYLVYLNGKLIGDICANELFLKRTPTSDRLLADSELRYPYEGSKTLMHVFDSFDDNNYQDGWDVILEYNCSQLNGDLSKNPK